MQAVPRNRPTRPNRDQHEDIPRVHKMSSTQGTNRSIQSSDSTHKLGKPITLPKDSTTGTKGVISKQVSIQNPSRA
jgi:hypothetical protein